MLTLALSDSESEYLYILSRSQDDSYKLKKFEDCSNHLKAGVIHPILCVMPHIFFPYFFLFNHPFIAHVPIFSVPLLLEKTLKQTTRPQNIIGTIRLLTKSLSHSKVISNTTQVTLLQ